MDRIFAVLKDKLTVVILTLPRGYIHVDAHYSQTSFLVCISGERLQNHWSSGTCILLHAVHIVYTQNVMWFYMHVHSIMVIML